MAQRASEQSLQAPHQKPQPTLEQSLGEKNYIKKLWLDSMGLNNKGELAVLADFNNTVFGGRGRINFKRASDAGGFYDKEVFFPSGNSDTPTRGHKQVYYSGFQYVGWVLEDGQEEKSNYSLVGIRMKEEYQNQCTLNVVYNQYYVTNSNLANADHIPPDNVYYIPPSNPKDKPPLGKRRLFFSTGNPETSFYMLSGAGAYIDGPFHRREHLGNPTIVNAMRAFVMNQLQDLLAARNRYTNEPAFKLR